MAQLPAAKFPILGGHGSNDLGPIGKAELSSDLSGFAYSKGETILTLVEAIIQLLSCRRFLISYTAGVIKFGIFIAGICITGHKLKSQNLI